MVIYWIFLCSSILQSLLASKEFTIREDAPIGKVIVNLGKLLNLDMSTKPYLKIMNPPVDYFAINQNTGDLYVQKHPDCDGLPLCRQSHRYDCRIGLNVYYGSLQVPLDQEIIINIQDVNDNPPKFLSKTITVNLRENASPSEKIIKLSEAEDDDIHSEVNGVKFYRISGPDAYLFDLSSNEHQTPQLIVNTELDREEKSNYTILLLAIDKGNPQLTGTQTVHLQITDVNDHKPKFEQTHYEKTIDEDISIGSAVLEVKAIDKDDGRNGRVSYYMSTPKTKEEKLANEYFEMETIGPVGVLKVKSQPDVDHTGAEKLDFLVEARDKGDPPLTSSVRITVRIRDVNDNQPHVRVAYMWHGNDTSRGAVKENMDGAVVAEIAVSDWDSRQEGEIQCKTNDDRFQLNEISSRNFEIQVRKKYRLTLRRSLDRETTPIIRFHIICIDNHFSNRKPQLTGTAEVTVKVADVNDCRPKFSREIYNMRLQENLPTIHSRRQKVGSVFANDSDEGVNAQITYSLYTNPDNSFEIDPKTGVIYAVASFDREKEKVIKFIVQAIDNGTESRLTSTATVEVEIVDSNDCVPIFDHETSTFFVPENTHNAYVGEVTARDCDEGDNAMLYYSLEQGARTEFFQINSKTGRIHLKSSLDREQQDNYEFHVYAIDNIRGSVRHTGTSVVIVRVQDLNDNSPKIAHPKDGAEIQIPAGSSTVGNTVFTARAADSDYGNNGTVRYAIETGGSDYFAMDPTTGVCYLKKTLSRNSPNSFSLRFKAYDLGEPITLNSSITVRLIRKWDGFADQQYNNGDKKSSAYISDQTIIIILITLFLLFLFTTAVVLIMVRYRHIFMRNIRTANKKPGNSNAEQERINEGQFYMATNNRQDKMSSIINKNEHLIDTSLLKQDDSPGDYEQHKEIFDPHYQLAWNKPGTLAYYKYSNVRTAESDRIEMNPRTITAAPDYQSLDEPPAYPDINMEQYGRRTLHRSNNNQSVAPKDLSSNFYYEVNDPNSRAAGAIYGLYGDRLEEEARSQGVAAKSFFALESGGKTLSTTKQPKRIPAAGEASFV